MQAPERTPMKSLDVSALLLMGTALYIGCAMAGLWWTSGMNALVAGFILLFAVAIAYERGYKGYWRSGYKAAFFGVFALPLFLGTLVFVYGLLAR